MAKCLVDVAIFLNVSLDISTAIARQPILCSQTRSLVSRRFVLQQRLYFFTASAFCLECFALVGEKNKNYNEYDRKHFFQRQLLSLSLTNILLSRINSHEVLQIYNFNQWLVNAHLS